MSNQLQITGGAKVRNLEGVITGATGVLGSVPYGGPNGVATLDSGGKVPVSQLPASVVTYLGTWNAATNTPTLTNGVGDAGDLYICNIAGTANFGAGPVTFAVGDWVLYGSGTWQKSSGQNGTVTSVAASITGNSIGLTGSPITTAGTLAFAFAGTSGQYINGAGNLVTFPSFSGYVPYTGATQTLDMGAWDVNARGIKINGTGGLGHIDYKHQSAGPAGSASSSTLYANVDGDLAWKNDHSYTSVLSAHANTADRVYTFPDASGTLALTSDISYPVTSVFGRTGAVVATSGDYTTSLVTEGTNLYFTNARARSAISLTTTGTSGASTYNSTTGVLNIPQYQAALTNPVTGTGASNYIAKFTGTSTIANSLIQDNGTNISMNGSIYSSALLTLRSIGSTGTTYGIYLLNSSSVTNFYVNDAGSAYFAVGVGIATSPTSANALEVGGSGKFTSSVTASSLIKTGGTSSQFLKADGSVDSTTYQGAITLTTTGTSGAATFVGNTLNIPNYGSALSGYLPLTGGTLTGALIGTTATFNSGASSQTLTLQSTGAASQIWLSDSGTTAGYVRISSNANSLIFYANLTQQLSLFSSGASAFSGSVTATSFIKTSGTSSQYLMADGSVSTLSNPVTGTGTTNYVPKFTGTGTIGNSNLINDASGNVGIGTTSPNELLSLAGYTSTTFGVSFLPSGWNGAKFRYSVPTSGNAAILSYNWNGSARDYTGYGTSVIGLTDAQITFGVGNAANPTTAMTISPSGNVLLGSTTNIFSENLLVNNSGTDAARTTINNTKVTGWRQSDLIFSTNSSNNFQIGTIIGASGFDDQLWLRGVANLPMTFRTNDTERMRITSGGSVLIGSTDAAYGTFVAASSNSSGYTTASIRNMAGGAAYGVQGAQLNFYGDGGYSASVPTAFIKVISNQDGNNGHGAMTFGTHNGNGSATEKLRIVSSDYGQLYLKGTFPSYYLQRTDNSTTAAGKISFVTANGTERMNIATNSLVGTGLEFNYGNSNFGYITTGGNWLVGTTTDSGDKFQVSGSVASLGSTSGLLFQDRSGASKFVWYATGGTPYFYNTAVGNIATINATTGIYTPLSDINKKKDFELSTIGLNAIMNLKPTLFRMKEESNNTEKTLGFIAQEVKEFIPQAYVENGDFIGLSDRPIIAALVKSIQELKQELDTLKNK